MAVLCQLQKETEATVWFCLICCWLKPDIRRF